MKTRKACVHCGCLSRLNRSESRVLLRSGIGFVGSGIVFVLIPKCPMCIAAYLAFCTSAGTALAVAVHIRPLLGAAATIFASIAVLSILLGRHVGGLPLFGFKPLSRR